jgi:hypothetical protein
LAAIHACGQIDWRPSVCPNSICTIASCHRKPRVARQLLIASISVPAAVRSSPANGRWLIAQQQFRARHGVDWHRPTRRAHQRWRNRVKKTLHTRVADHMTRDRLAERDPQGELVSWLEAIVHLMDLVR